MSTSSRSVSSAVSKEVAEKPEASETSSKGENSDKTSVHYAQSTISTATAESRKEPSLSQDEDRQIRQLEDAGALTDIVGSQSVLSQELAECCGQAQTAEHENTVSASTLMLSSQVVPDNTATDKTMADQVPSSSSSAVHPSQLLCLVDAVEAVAKKRQAAHDDGDIEMDQGDLDGTGLCNLPPLVTRKQLRQQASARRVQREQEVVEAQRLARRAASLAKEIVSSAELSKRLLLSMALVRTNPRSPPAKWPGKGHIIKEGFFWATYPPLEVILKSHMEEFYDLSMKRCQSKSQQRFNTMLVDIIRDKAKSLQWKFASKFTDKVLRDRIRCFYKTHIQNAKKRVRTMVKNPTKRANAKQLLLHYNLISEHAGHPEEGKKSIDKKNNDKKNYQPYMAGSSALEEEEAAINPYPLTGPYPLEQRREKHVKATLAARGPVDAEVHKVAQIMSLGFQNLSQDEYVKRAPMEI